MEPEHFGNTVYRFFAAEQSKSAGREFCRPSVAGAAAGAEQKGSDPALGPDPLVLGRPSQDDGPFGEAALAPVIVVLPHPPTVAGDSFHRYPNTQCAV